MRTAAWICVGIVLLAVAPNLLWLERSTLRIENLGATTVGNVRFEVCGSTFELGALVPGDARFRLLPKCGDATLSVTTGPRARRRQICQLYVEGAMYHVDVWVGAEVGEGCDYDFPPFSSLLVAKLW